MLRRLGWQVPRERRARQEVRLTAARPARPIARAAEPLGAMRAGRAHIQARQPAAAHDRLGHVGAVEVDAVQHAVVELGTDEPRAGEVAAFDAHASQAGLAQIGAGERTVRQGQHRPAGRAGDRDPSQLRALQCEARQRDRGRAALKRAHAVRERELRRLRAVRRAKTSEPPLTRLDVCAFDDLAEEVEGLRADHRQCPCVAAAVGERAGQVQGEEVLQQRGVGELEVLRLGAHDERRGAQILGNHPEVRALEPKPAAQLVV